jgi:hypothetical protein
VLQKTKTKTKKHLGQALVILATQEAENRSTEAPSSNPGTEKKKRTFASTISAFSLDQCEMRFNNFLKILN